MAQISDRMYADAALQAHQSKIFTQSRPPHVQVYPPGMSKDVFQTVCDELRSIAGEENFFVEKGLMHFMDPFFWNEKKHIPSAAVCPASTTEVQKILEVANRYGVRLWPTSRGKNLGYGGPAPRVTGSIVVMLYRMNKILEVNEKLAYIAVEPGVTFFDIYNHVRDNNLGVWPSVPGLGWGSVVGNTLDRGFGYTSHGDHHNFICGLEVVLANGDIVRTGQWAIEESKAGPACKMSFGPQIEGLFVQSNLGIVTKMALWVQPQPQVCMSVQIHGEEAEDIIPLIDVLGKLYQEGVLQNDPNIVNVFNYAALQTQRAKYHEGEGPLTYEETKRLQKDLGGGYWLCSLHFYGNKGMVTARFQALKEVFDKTFPQARIESDWYEGADQKLLDAEAVKSRPLGAGVPSMDRVKTFSFNLPLGSANFGAHTDVSPILPRDGKSVWAWFQEALKIVNSYGYDLIVGGHLFQKHVVFVHPYIFNRDDPSNLEIAHKMTTELLAKSKELKHPSYRAHLMWMDEIQEHYDFNNHAYRRFVEELKKTLDPKGILAPGKQGIWPRSGITP